ncbi:hypothetical protein [Amycolatopsis nigrescens]|uniref:hypothetical protein n=1 Tax=Amycolatopsis nigrescens TaxID=381445 RepID=UPI0005902720|nr:hypothetical protein [Amycolatopsis nigrescens]
MNERDIRLLDRVRELHRYLTQRTVALVHCQSDPDLFAEGMRDLGQDLHDAGTALLDRVHELDAGQRSVTVPSAATRMPACGPPAPQSGPFG